MMLFCQLGDRSTIANGAFLSVGRLEHMMLFCQLGDRSTVAHGIFCQLGDHSTGIELNYYSTESDKLRQTSTDFDRLRAEVHVLDLEFSHHDHLSYQTCPMNHGKMMRGGWPTYNVHTNTGVWS